MFVILDSVRQHELQVFSKKKLHFLEKTTFSTTFISQQKSTNSRHKNLSLFMWVLELTKIYINLMERERNIVICNVISMLVKRKKT